MALSFGLTAAMRSRCASTISFEESFLDRIAAASSLADDWVIGLTDCAAAPAELANKPDPAAAAAPASATEPKKSRRAIFSLMWISNADGGPAR